MSVSFFRTTKTALASGIFVVAVFESYHLKVDLVMGWSLCGLDWKQGQVVVSTAPKYCYYGLSI